MTARFLLPLVALLACTAAGQMPADPAKPHAVVQKAPRPVAKDDPFAVTHWFEIPTNTNIALGPDPHAKRVDLTVREDANNINVFGRKQKFEPRQWFRTDYDEPWTSSAAKSVDMPVKQNSSCEGAAYNTIGGQPGTGRDMIGALANGSSC